MEVCEVCGQTKKNLGSHVRQAHGMSMDEYQAVAAENTELTDELNEELPTSQPDEGSNGLVITQAERKAGILDVESRINEDMSVRDLCKFKGITFKELGSIISQYVAGTTPPTTQTVDKNEKVGADGAAKLNGEANPTTPSVWIAEALVKQYGYVVSHKTQNPTMWHLKKP